MKTATASEMVQHNQVMSEKSDSEESEDSMGEFDETFEEEMDDIEPLEMEEISDEDLKDNIKPMSESRLQSSVRESDVSMSVSHIDMDKENLNRYNSK